MRKEEESATTKKEQIISLVRNDPFLSIEEIANKADTTGAYVRVLLHNVDIRLRDLRKEYYKDLEKRYKEELKNERDS